MSHQHRYKQRDFDFAQRLLILRRRARLTQAEAAQHIGVTAKSIGNWEAGSNYPSDAHLEKLVELYLDNLVFTSEHEQDEAHELWDRLREMIPRRIGLFDEQWFARLLKERQARRASYKQALPQEQPATPEPGPRLAILPLPAFSRPPGVTGVKRLTCLPSMDGRRS